ncbi:HEAT repeat domain-containing protein [Streptomyces sp. DT224]|uniref:HEAT repeat domain-containing protein n=1 Tax=Streptomyces sp. DT224 TaxID=3393426 RepID=UPI003CEAF660
MDQRTPLAEPGVTHYREALSHSDSGVRHQALRDLEKLGGAAVGMLAEVLPFLNARDSGTRYVATRTVRAIGAGTGPLLRDIRRGGPARLRRHALTALGVIGEADLLDERDRRALHRLIRIKAARDTPDALPDHQWMAVPGATYEGLFDALGLHHRIPCTLAMGLSASERDSVDITGPDGTRQTAYRVFVTPELDGWRLIYANSALTPRVWDFGDVIERLSAACGQAQFFAQDEHSDSMIWAVAIDGVLRRRYWRNETPEWTGEPMEWEEPMEDDPFEEHAPGATAECDTNAAAWALSLVPEDIGADTTLRGHGWLAVSRPDVDHFAFPGALPI